MFVPSFSIILAVRVRDGSDNKFTRRVFRATPQFILPPPPLPLPRRLISRNENEVNACSAFIEELTGNKTEGDKSRVPRDYPSIRRANADYRKY